jgi:2'-5' RNA ligase
MGHEGFERETRAFRPHLTLARVRAPRGWRAFRPSVERLRAQPFGKTQIDAMTLFSSTLGAGPARYDAIAALPFGAGAARDVPRSAASAAQAGPRD